MKKNDAIRKKVIKSATTVIFFLFDPITMLMIEFSLICSKFWYYFGGLNKDKINS